MNNYSILLFLLLSNIFAQASDDKKLNYVKSKSSLLMTVSKDRAESLKQESGLQKYETKLLPLITEAIYWRDVCTYYGKSYSDAYDSCDRWQDVKYKKCGSYHCIKKESIIAQYLQKFDGIIYPSHNFNVFNIAVEKNFSDQNIKRLFDLKADPNALEFGFNIDAKCGQCLLKKDHQCTFDKSAFESSDPKLESLIPKLKSVLLTQDHTFEKGPCRISPLYKIPLFTAIENSNLRLVQLLIDIKTDVNCRNVFRDDCYSCVEKTEVPLQCYFSNSKPQKGSLDMLKVLLSANPRLCYPDNGTTIIRGQEFRVLNPRRENDFFYSLHNSKIDEKSVREIFDHITNNSSSFSQQKLPLYAWSTVALNEKWFKYIEKRMLITKDHINATMHSMSVNSNCAVEDVKNFASVILQQQQAKNRITFFLCVKDIQKDIKKIIPKPILNIIIDKVHMQALQDFLQSLPYCEESYGKKRDSMIQSLEKLFL